MFKFRLQRVLEMKQQSEQDAALRESVAELVPAVAGEVAHRQVRPYPAGFPRQPGLSPSGSELQP